MAGNSVLNDLKCAVKSYPDFPKQGVVFRDFFPILQNPRMFDAMLELYRNWLADNSIAVDCIAGLDSRGFLLGPSLALKLNVPFVPIRKAGKLPGNTRKEVYSLEYGSDALEIQVDSLKTGLKVVIIDDLLATGGTMAAAVKLVNSTEANVIQCLVLIELDDLNGRQKINAPIHSLIHF